MIVMEGVTFQIGDVEGLGSPNEQPVHAVTVSSFAIGACEVAFEEYDAFAKATGRELLDDEGWGRGQRPVINVSWEDAQAYAQWVSKQTGQPYRLPTEAEWEYVARSGDRQERWAGTSDEKQLDEYAVYATNSGNQTAEVGSKKANPFGLHDLSGNVWEWVEDCWHENYDQVPTKGEAWLETEGGECSRRMVRGGSWDFIPEFLRLSFRYVDTIDGPGRRRRVSSGPGHPVTLCPVSFYPFPLVFSLRSWEGEITGNITL